MAVGSKAILADARALHQAGQHTRALSLLAGLRPSQQASLDYWFLSAEINLALQQPQRAIDACLIAQSLAPGNPDTHFNLGLIYQTQDKTSEAATAYLEALGLDSRHTGTLRNYPTILFAQGKSAEALALSVAAIGHYPQDALLHYNHAELLISTGQEWLAQVAFETSLALQPELHIARAGLSLSLAMQGQLKAAYQARDDALAAEPSLDKTYRNPLRLGGTRVRGLPDPALVAALACADRIRQYQWATYKQDVALFEDLIHGKWGAPLDAAELPHVSLLVPVSGVARQTLARNAAAATFAPFKNTRLFRPRHFRTPHEKISIGYLSADFRSHPVGRHFSHTFTHHDRSTFRVYLYSTSASDHSPERQFITKSVDSFVDAEHMPAPVLAQRMVHDKIDILVDLSGYTAATKPATFMLKPAPIQVAFLGYMGTLGSSSVDYTILSKEILTDEERLYWDESVAYIPHALVPSLPIVSAPDIARSEFGLPTEGIILGALHSPRKLNPDSIALWLSTLAENGTALLWLLYEAQCQIDAILQLADHYGISHKRIIFSPQVDQVAHLRRLCCVDLLLDTPRFNGATTTLEALSCGVPVVTLQGTRPEDRVAANLLRAHKLPELIATTPEGFLALVSRYISDTKWRSAIQRQTRQYQGSDLFCPERWLRNIESAYIHMWERHQAGLPPEDFDVFPHESLP